ncbi:MAG: hypothetical protein JSV52_14530 [Candidatus Zixiibacteriota bacterium]|nr:MAG: hypothetical protein JSV52_14530 [candidate division Zixibacteria bacterium]
MKTTKLITLAIIILAVVAASCGDKKKAKKPVGTADYLVATVDSIGLERTTDPELYVGDSLWEYINGGAELYHLYNFVEVATAYYNKQGVEMVVDIYKFDSPEYAFGLYSMLRPEKANPVELGVEGFGSVTNLVFVKGQYVVMLTGFDQSEEVATAISSTGPVFEEIVPGILARPAVFDIFPADNAIDGSAKLFAESFLGQAFLRNVYTVSYALAEDTLRLFLTYDQGGAKFIEWKDISGTQPHAAASTLPYDDGLVILLTDSYYGTIVAGLKAGMLVGAVGYKQGNEEFLRNWLNSITPTS